MSAVAEAPLEHGNPHWISQDFTVFGQKRRGQEWLFVGPQRKLV